MRPTMPLLLLLLSAAPAAAQTMATPGLAEANNVRQHGALGNGVSVDLKALLAAPSPVFLPAGTYYTGTSIYALQGNRRYSAMGGDGRIATLESGRVVPQSPDLSIISHPPAPPLGGGFNRMFSGDMSAVHLAFQTEIKGPDTLGRPTSGWHINPATAGIAGFLFIDRSAGFSNGLHHAGQGRTGAAASYIQLQHAGNGDATAYFGAAAVSGTNPGATSFLANPAAGLFGGQVSALAPGVYLQGVGDINLNDKGHDVAGIGAVFNLNRTVGTGALGATWIGVRVQQSSGKIAYDAAYSAAGKGAIGLDLSSMTLQNAAGVPTHSAIALAAGQRIMGNARDGGPFPTAQRFAPGADWLSYETASGWNLVVGAKPVLQAAAGGVSATELRITAPHPPASASAPCTQGQIAYDSQYAYVCVAANSWKRAALSSW